MRPSPSFGRKLLRTLPAPLVLWIGFALFRADSLQDALVYSAVLFAAWILVIEALHRLVQPPDPNRH
jgi:hypothetical protein